jgi:hypothetical protein
MGGKRPVGSRSGYIDVWNAAGQHRPSYVFDGPDHPGVGPATIVINERRGAFRFPNLIPMRVFFGHPGLDDAIQRKRLERSGEVAEPAPCPPWRDSKRARLPPLIRRVFEALSDDPHNIRFSTEPERLSRLRLSKREERILLGWGAKTRQTKAMDPRNPDNALELLRRLLSVRIDMSLPEGPPTVKALSDLGILPEISARMLGHLLQRSARIPKNVHFHYNGHLTSEIVELFMGLDALGLKSGSVSRSSQGGVPEVARFLESRLTNSSCFGSLLNFASWRTRESIAPFLGSGDRTGSIVQRALDAVAAGEIFILDKVSDLLHPPVPQEILDAMMTGQIRCIIHNRDDRDAIALLPRHVQSRLWGVDLSSSRGKAFEASVIGENYVLLAARDIREHWKDERLIDVPVVIVGHGLLGSRISAALRALGYPADRVIVRDIDLDAESEAVRLGHRALEQARRTRSAMVLVATPDRAIDAATIAEIPADRILLMALTSGGKAVDLASLEAASTTEPVVTGNRVGGFDYHKGAPRTFSDLLYTIPSSHGPIELTVAAAGQQLNLIEPQWADRHAPVTGAGGVLSFAVLTAANLAKPGIVKPLEDASWLEFEDELLGCARELGLDRIRPLEARENEEESLLRGDLEQFPGTRNADRR